MAIIINDLKKNEDLDRSAVMRFCRGGKKQAAGMPFQKPSSNDLKERLLKYYEAHSEEI